MLVSLSSIASVQIGTAKMNTMTAILVFGAVLGFVTLLISALFFLTVMLGDHYPAEIEDEFE